ncbi:hypothetical protein LPA44_09305 [Halobacterium sp. KA-4]|uniref:hypothetical protein n=1 Tax=Halobacterium sp. KA-4 TaxID=2896367 RepID=UPI001E56D2B1|nr:hypothetical protein [Halobacterium sp. KA-4]MCD2200094.1 hypothetical protein [Halobacterium sp. KA-4]
MVALVEQLYDVRPGDDVVVETDDGTRVAGRPSRIERDEAGVRIELCPGPRNAPQYRVRAVRTPGGWESPRVERRPMGGEWTDCGELAALA